MNPRKHVLVLSIYCNNRGFGFVLFEGPLAPFDWGVRVARGAEKISRLLARVEHLLKQYQPDILILQDVIKKGRFGPTVLGLVAEIRAIVERQGVPVYSYSRDDVERAFASYGAANKQHIAELIARHIPAFERYVPPPRKPWMSEDTRMGLFDAAALGLVFYGAAL